MADSRELFKRLARLFRSGPIVKRKVKDWKAPVASSAIDVFKKTYSHMYSSAINAYGYYDRLSRYSDYSEMEYTPEIASALDIYADESTAQDQNGNVLHILSENSKIRQLLHELFYDNLNINFNLCPWVRHLCKYGDFFLFNDVSEEHGLINVFPIPVNEIEREEGWDPDDPLAVRFRWATQGNQELQNWQVTHFRILGNESFLPYGTSILESARRIWRQLILIEDAMLVYRVIRSPERRVFYIDVGNVPPEDIQNYMEQAKSALKSSQVIDKKTGRVDLRYNPMSVDEDYFLPVRGSESGTKIDTLAGGTNVSAIEDVEYIQKKLFSALKVPKAYLGYDEALTSKATLAQEDIRFSRTINKIQRVILAELNKLATIHLFANGYTGEDLIDFELQLSNPSSIAQQQKLELFRTRFEIAGTTPEGVLSIPYIQKNIFGLTDDDIAQIQRQQETDKLRSLKLEGLQLPGADSSSGASPPELLDDEEPATGESEDEEELSAGDIDDDKILTAADFDSETTSNYSMSDTTSPDRAEKKIKKTIPKGITNSKRRRKQFNSDIKGPNFSKIVNIKNYDVYDKGHFKNPLATGPVILKENTDNDMSAFWDLKTVENARLTEEVQSMLKNFGEKIVNKD
jgi:hypothetical protein